MPYWHVLGLGSVGSVSAWRLLNAGINVRVLPKTPTQTISRCLHFPEHAPCTISPTSIGNEAIDKLLITVKAADTAAALQPWRSRLRTDATIICLQNGMGALSAHSLPENASLIYAITTDGVWRDGDQIHVVAENQTLMGDGGANVPPWFAALQPHWPGLQWCEDIERARWRKLAVNAVINPLTAIYGCKNGELLDGGERQQAMHALASEVDLLARQLFTDWPGDTPARSHDIAQQTAANTSSMLADILAGRRTEIDYINGFLLHQALALGLALPAHQQITAQIRSSFSFS